MRADDFPIRCLLRSQRGYGALCGQVAVAALITDRACGCGPERHPICAECIRAWPVGHVLIGVTHFACGRENLTITAVAHDPLNEGDIPAPVVDSTSAASTQEAP